MSGAERFLDPSTAWGALLYAALALGLAWAVSRAIRLLIRGAVRRDRTGIIDRTAAHFFVEFARAVVYVVALTLYVHLVPALQGLGTVLLAGVSVTSVVFGLAASSTLSNLIAGISLLLYFPYRVGDTVRLGADGAAEPLTIESINLGYTLLLAQGGETLVVPNSVLIGTAVRMVEGAPSAGADARR